ncbi:MAG: hypothetical protein HY585_01270, partial [Candidatus Omnitrophica bacterium]|nr:hypothetical protein [Candidatus Omnitrophota bacterium]
MSENQKNKWFRAIGFLVVLSLVNFQVLGSYTGFSFQNFVYAEVPPENQSATTPFGPTAAVPVSEPSEVPVQHTQADSPQTDIDFSMSESPLSAPTEEEIQETSREVKANDNYVTEIYDSASGGMHELQAGMPVAYLAKTLRVEDLRALRNHHEEVGILIAGDTVVIFSTGDERFIRNLSPLRELTESSLVSLSAHFH